MGKKNRHRITLIEEYILALIGAAISLAGGIIGGMFTETSNQLNSSGEVNNLDAILFSGLQWGAINVVSIFLGSTIGMGKSLITAYVGNYIFKAITGVIGYVLDYIRSEKIN